MGLALSRLGEVDEAVTAFRQAIALQPRFAEAYLGLGNALQQKGDRSAAMVAYQQALALKPDLNEAHVCVGFLRLQAGDFLNGWAGLDHRLKCAKQILGQELPQAFWDGSPLLGRRILLRAEQGFGDTIQFIRFVPQVAACGGSVIVQCQPELHRLLRGQLGIERLISRKEAPPDFDVQYPLMSLPGLFGVTSDTVRDAVPYLSADVERSTFWKERLDGSSKKLKVGLAWAGRPTHKDDRNRSITFESLAPIFQTPGTRFISLQVGPSAAQAQTHPSDVDVAVWTKELSDFAETAALIANLDLVIAVDTAVVHLAGALGKPVWTLLPCSPDWRWMLDRDDTPWYPQMRLFRQSKAGDWESVIRWIATELAVTIERG